MAQQQAFQAYPNNKGTLIPGQTIAVNKYNVQVERYLSQGGFAHVYLVRTATPVYNTTHHVLKRIAVANDAMLTEVKKEVDIMRILKGHPNIVHLIDAAWHRMPNGMYEVFILMEFCPGGGIIDMMNRRLRERLTEAEILQIFVDVCEGVAAMHNLRPALLHRDLKVENILQSSPTSFKLCDFGSATPVAPRVPSTNTEIRALEAELNRHTTLQYRAPEMVDPYLRRPIDEKSDVWALGVLLYKLCYYTTPFEEHGPLAILNVQYRIPPYPVYSQQMNGLIGSMLREHGAQRPTVFEVLSIVHRLRDTKSRFTYTIPSPKPLSPRLTTTSPNAPAANVLDNLVSFRTSNSPGRNVGVQAREKVLEAIAPMRRGRPTSSAPVEINVNAVDQPGANVFTSRSSSPQKDRKGKNWLDDDFEAGWQNVKKSQSPDVKGHKASGDGGAPDAWKVRSPAPSSENARNVGSRAIEKKQIPGGGFDNDFGEKLWDSFDGRTPPITTASPVPSSSSPIPPFKPTSFPSSSRLALSKSGKDAFDGLGLSSSDRLPAPTLGEARKLRTGLAVVNSYSQPASTSRPPSSRPTPSPRPSPIPPSVSPAWQQSSSQPLGTELAPEARFPSLEELDATFASPSPPHSVPIPHPSSQPPPPRPSVTGGLGLRPPAPQRQTTYGQDGVRSEQVTGIAMRESREAGASRRHAPVEPSTERSLLRSEVRSRPTLSRKHRSSISIKHRPQSRGADMLSPTDQVASPRQAPSPRLPSKPQPDWLTGDDMGDMKQPGTPVLRDSPSKRASYIERSGAEEGQAASAKAQTVVVEREPETLPSPPEPPEAVKLKRASIFAPRASHLSSVNITAAQTPITSSSTSLTDNWSPIAMTSSQAAAALPPKNEKDSSSSDAEESPEDVNGFAAAAKQTRRRKGKGRQSSVHDLVDLWGGGVPTSPTKGKERDRELMQNTNISPAKDTEPTQILARGLTGSGSGALKRRETVLGSASTTYKISHPFPQGTTSTPAAPAPPNRSPKSPTSRHRKQPSTGNAALNPIPAPSPGRSRPQSMFIFPVAKTDSDVSTLEGGAAPSPGLVPPQDPKPRASRRTSISDMVQRYEAIVGGGGKAAGPPPIVSKPTGLKVATQNPSATGVVNGRESGAVSPVAVRSTRRGNSSLPVSGDVMNGSGDPTKQRTSPTGLPRTSPLSQSLSGNKATTTGLPSRASPIQKPSATQESSSNLEPPTFPTRKATTPPPESSQTSPPSPDRPYQGVGKLIDQWQRKTVDSDASRGPAGPKRGSFVAKRAGLVSGGASRGR